MNTDCMIREYLTQCFGPDHQYVLDILKSSVDQAHLVFFHGSTPSPSDPLSFIRAFPSHLFCFIPCYTLCAWTDPQSDHYVSGKSQLDHPYWSYPLIKVLNLSESSKEWTLDETKANRYLSPDSKIVIKELNRFAVAVDPFYPRSIFVLTDHLPILMSRQLRDKTRVISFTGQGQVDASPDIVANQSVVDSLALPTILHTHLMNYIQRYGQTDAQAQTKERPRPMPRPMPIQFKHLAKQDYEY